MLIAKQRTQEGLQVHPGALKSPAPPFSVSGLGSLVYVLIRMTIGGVFVVSGVGKLLAPEGFAVIIEAYGLIPEATVLPAAITLSLLELLAGLGLVWDFQGSLGLITGLLLLFMTILGYGLWIGLDVDCGCFGPGDPEAEAFHGMRTAFYRDMGMLVGNGYLYFWRRIGSIRPRALLNLNNLIPKRRQIR